VWVGDFNHAMFYYSVVGGHCAGGPMLMGFGTALIAFGVICCIYSRRPPLPRRPPPPNPQVSFLIVVWPI
jgi:hypothetical protein